MLKTLGSVASWVGMLFKASKSRQLVIKKDKVTRNSPCHQFKEYKVAKCRVMLSLRDSNNDVVKQADITIRSGRKWAANAAVEQAVSSLKL